MCLVPPQVKGLIVAGPLPCRLGSQQETGLDFLALNSAPRVQLHWSLSNSDPTRLHTFPRGGAQTHCALMSSYQ